MNKKILKDSEIEYRRYQVLQSNRKKLEMALLRSIDKCALSIVEGSSSEKNKELADQVARACQELISINIELILKYRLIKHLAIKEHKEANKHVA